MWFQEEKKQLISVFLGTKMVRWFKHPGGGGSRIGSIPLGVTPNYIAAHYMPIAPTLCLYGAIQYNCIITHRASMSNCTETLQYKPQYDESFEPKNQAC